jgi:fumarate reductase subunit D
VSAVGFAARRRGAGVWAFLVHRVSGIALVLFLPLHFWALGQAIQGEVALDGFLRWADRPLVKLAEWALVVLLAAHLAGGLRLLAVEFLPWSDRQKTWIALGAGFSLLAGLVFLLNLL